MLWKSRCKTLDLSHRSAVMGILNVTPDSFSDGGRYAAPEQALARAREMIADGADLIDIGGESTRPGSDAVSADEEIRRTLPVIRALRAEWDGWISVDTAKAAVAAEALAAGADVVNDVTGLRGDPDMAAVCARAACGVVVMHMRGTPKTMQRDVRYDDVVREVEDFFQERKASLTGAGIAPESIVWDPGIGFGKLLEHNVALLRSLGRLCEGGRPILLGASRKSFIAGLLGDPDPSLRDWPTVAVTAWARDQGVMIHRVHDVRPNREALRMVEAILGGAG